jgi:hypothetical protein
VSSRREIEETNANSKDVLKWSGEPGARNLF